MNKEMPQMEEALLIQSPAEEQFHPEVCAGILNEEEPIDQVVSEQRNTSNGKGMLL